MKALIGIVTGQSIKKNLDGAKNVRMSQVRITEPEDIQTIEWQGAPGDDSAPVEGDEVAIIEISDSYKIAVASSGSIEPDAEAGERKLYSQDSGVVKASIYLKKDGQMVLNGGSDFAVAYNDLKTGFDQLKSDFNAFLVHVHGTSGTPPVPPALPSTADISASKVDTINLP